MGTTEQLLHLRQQWNEVKENKQLAHLHHGGLVASMWNDAGLASCAEWEYEKKMFKKVGVFS